MKKYILCMLVLAVLSVYGCSQQNEQPTNTGITTSEEGPSLDEDVAPVAEEVVEGPAEAQGEDVETNAEEPKTSTVTEPAIVDIDISGFAFGPATITIKKGTTVRWTQKDSTRHSVTSDDDIFDSQLLSQGKTWSHTFNDAGTFKYHCRPHSSMRGEVIVE